MKKRIISVLLIAVTALSLAGCGKFECDLCGKEKSGKSYTEKIFGEKVTICKDCYDDLNALGNMLGF